MATIAGVERHRLAELEHELGVLRQQLDTLHRQIEGLGTAPRAVQPPHVQAAEDRAAEHRRLDRVTADSNRYRSIY